LKTKDEIRDQRLQQKYGITLEEYNQRLAECGGVCEICGRAPKTKSLHCDHDHKSGRVKVDFSQIPSGLWIAKAKYNGGIFIATGLSKSEVSKNIRHMLKGASWRGVLCWPCNRALQSFRDDPQLMRAAAVYLERFQHTSAVPPAPTSGEKT